MSAIDWIHMSEIVAGRVNVKVLPTGRKVLVLREGGAVRVFGELCPHMGADLSGGRYCERTGTLQCRWHGYVFSTADGRFLENPNERLMQLLRQSSPQLQGKRAPRYRLSVVPHAVDGDRIHFLPKGSGRPDVEVTGGRFADFEGEVEEHWGNDAPIRGRVRA